MSREWTEEEVRQMWLKHVWSTIDYWERKGAGLSARDLLKRMAFSLLSTIDGATGGMPGFILAPRPHPEDRQTCIDEGVNYFPENHEATIKADIAGELHELFHELDTSKEQ